MKKIILTLLKFKVYSQVVEVVLVVVVVVVDVVEAKLEMISYSYIRSQNARYYLW